MDVHQFHHKLLGINKGRTPEEFRLQDIHAALYDAFMNQGLHGYANSKQDEALFMATLVLALCLTEVIYPCYIGVPKPLVRWVIDQIERVGRHIFRSRKGDKEGVLVLRRAFKQIRVTHEILKMPEEPERWVLFGFTNEDILPAWAKGKLLLDYGELQAPLNGVRTTNA